MNTLDDFWRQFEPNFFSARKATVIRRHELPEQVIPLSIAHDLTCRALTEPGATSFSKNGFAAATLTASPATLALSDTNDFIDALVTENDASELTLSVHNCQTWSTELLRRVRDFLAPLQSRVGVPGNGVNTFLFAGRYVETPVKLHTDPCDIFLMPILGPKKLITWPPEFFADENSRDHKGRVIPQRRPEIDYLSAIEHATILEADAGDILFFPAGTWHVNLYDEPTNSISIAVSLFRNFDAVQLTEPVLSGTLAKHRSNLVSNLKQATLERAEPTAALLDELENAVRLAYLQKLSAGGFMTGLEKRASPPVLSEDSPITIKPGNKIYLVRHGTTELALVCNGKVAKFTEAGYIRHLIDQVLNETPFCLAPMQLAPSERDNAMALCRWLAGCDALALAEVRP